MSNYPPLERLARFLETHYGQQWLDSLEQAGDEARRKQLADFGRELEQARVAALEARRRRLNPTGMRDQHGNWEFHAATNEGAISKRLEVIESAKAALRDAEESPPVDVHEFIAHWHERIAAVELDVLEDRGLVWARQNGDLALGRV